MNLSQIECFCAVAETLSFSEAAKRLYVTQPAASRMISAMEKAVGMELLRRDTRHVALTPAGEVMLRACQTMLNNYANGIAQSKLAEQGLVGSLKFGIMRDTFESSLPGLIRPFRERHPKIRIEMEGFSHSEIYEALYDRKVDAIYAASSRGAGDGRISTLNVLKLREAAVLPSGHPLAGRDGIYLSELFKDDFIIMSRTVSTPGYDQLMRLTAEAGFSPHIVAYARYVPELLSMVASGIGVSILAESSAELAVDYVATVPLKLVKTRWKRLEWLKENDNPCLKLFLQEAEQHPLSAN